MRCVVWSPVLSLIALALAPGAVRADEGREGADGGANGVKVERGASVMTEGSWVDRLQGRAALRVRRGWRRATLEAGEATQRHDEVTWRAPELWGGVSLDGERERSSWWWRGDLLVGVGWTPYTGGLSFGVEHTSVAVFPVRSWFALQAGGHAGLVFGAAVDAPSHARLGPVLGVELGPVLLRWTPGVSPGLGRACSSVGEGATLCRGAAPRWSWVDVSAGFLF